MGGCMIPIMTYVMINTVESELKSKANALANLSYYAIGYFPAPVIYGYICDYTGGKTSRWGFIFTFNLNFVTLILMVIAMRNKPDFLEYYEEQKASYFKKTKTEEEMI